MSRQSCYFLLSILIAVWFYEPVLAQSVSPNSTTRASSTTDGQALVLKNGSVIVGLIENVSGNFTVQTNQGSRLVIPSEKVEFVAESMEQVYWGRLARIRASDFESQRRLFSWCLQNNLLVEAENQLEVLQATELAADRIGQLRQQLQQRLINATDGSNVSNRDGARSPKPAQPPIVAAAIGGDMIETARLSEDEFFAQLDPVFVPLPSLTAGWLEKTQAPGLNQGLAAGGALSNGPRPGEVLQVGYSEALIEANTDHEIKPSKVSGGTTSTKSDSGPLSAQELESFVGELPKGTFGVFRQQLERKFLSHCSDCHDVRSSVTTAMPLMHAGKLQPTTRRMTQRNLQSVFAFVDRSDPLASRLLQASVTAHGGALAAPMSLDSREFENLKNWVVSLSLQPSPSVENSGAAPIEPGLFDEQKLTSQSVQPIRKLASDQVIRGDSTDPAGQQQLSPTIGEIPRLELRPTGFVPHDEFDPELFNRLSGSPDRLP